MEPARNSRLTDTIMASADQMVSGCTEHLADQEGINTLTHGAGFLLTIGATIYLATFAGTISTGLAASCLLYALTLMAVYAISTLSHAIQRPRAKFLLRAWDQGVIYLLIVGTYTPFVWTELEGVGRWGMLVAMWGAAIAGFYSKVVRQYRVNDFSARTYILLGWLPAMVLVWTVSTECLLWMVAGGVSYTLGTLFLTLDRHVRYFHAVWHLFVILASACHYYAIVTLVIFPAVK